MEKVEKVRRPVGGARPGSGRKPLPSGTVTLLVTTGSGGGKRPTRGVTISQDHWSAVERHRDANGHKSTSEAMRDVIERGTA